MVDLREPLDSLIAPPSRFTSGTTFPRAKEIRLYDTTLRDGEQTPGVAFTPEQKYELAGLLSDAGLRIIGMGFPAAAPSERRALELIVEGKKKGRIRPDLEIIVMCRSNARDIDITVDTLEQMGMRAADCTFFIFTSGSDLHLKYKIGKTLLQLEGRKPEEWLDLPVSFYREANIRMSTRAIAHARKRGVEEIEFGGEDGSRADVGYLIELARACYAAGGTRYSFPDTVGFFAPEGVDFYIPKLVAAFPDKPLVIHFHNDFGLGAYNTVRALHHGATIPTCTVNGIGERAGNAPLHTTVMILKELYGITIPGFRYECCGRCAASGVQRHAGGGDRAHHRPQRLLPRDGHPHRRHHDSPGHLPGHQPGAWAAACASSENIGAMAIEAVLNRREGAAAGWRSRRG